LKSNQLNTVSLKFTNKYVSNSAGFHRFEDPVDHEVYLYTHLEPFFCHRWFPCFDQPSIRAPLKLSVVTPDPTWSVVSNDTIVQTMQLQSHIAQSLLAQEGLTDAVERAGVPADGNLVTFEASPAISTYIYGLAAGPYCRFENSSGFKVPMSVYCRRSKAPHAEARERFRLIETAIGFFEELFSTPFPFKKYDQVFVPEFRISGMENVGVVILRDSFLRPAEEKTFFEFQMWYKVAIHELSHMWFGDLVTMKWWNDLWLKESFAEFCTCVCATECAALDYVKDPEQFHLHFLTEALNEDVRRTTHPVQQTIVHTNDAVNNFDKICYRKGACFLLQMDHILGREVMRDGIKTYFSKFAMKTATLDDFLECLQLALTKKMQNFDLKQWATSWLTKAGVNALEAEIQKRDDTFVININQSMPVHGDPVYHEQVIDVALYDKDCNPRVVADVRVQSAPQTKDAVTGLEQLPCAVLVNANNKGYCRTVIDPHSLPFFLENLSSIEDSLNRSLIWRVLCDNMKLGVISAEQFIVCVEKHLIKETEEITMSVVLATLQFVLKFLVDERQEHAIALHMVFLEKLEKNCPTKSMEVLVLNEMITLMQYFPSAAEMAVQWFTEG